MRTRIKLSKLLSASAVAGAAIAVLVLSVGQAFAVVPIPSAYWNFDNPEGQTLGNFDGFVPPSPRLPGDIPSPNLKLIVNQFNGAGGVQANSQFQAGTGGATFTGGGPYAQGGTYAYNYRSPGATGPAAFQSANLNYRGMWNADGSVAIPTTINANNTPPRENYIPSGASFPGSGSAYRMVGGIHNNYDPTSDGNPLINPQTDALATGGAFGGSGAQTPTVNNIFSWQDRLRLDPGTGGGSGSDSAVNSVGNLLAYSFWLNVFSATSDVDGSRFGTSTSYVIGRAAGGNAGSVGVKFAGSTLVETPSGSGNFVPTPTYKLHLFGSASQQSASASVVQGTWHHFTVLFDATNADALNGTYTLWMDGGATKQVFTGMGTGTINNLFRLNNAPSGTLKESGDFGLDDLAVWQGVTLSDQDAADIYSKGVLTAVPEPSTVVLGMTALLATGCFRRRQA